MSTVLPMSSCVHLYTHSHAHYYCRDLLSKALPSSSIRWRPNTAFSGAWLLGQKPLFYTLVMHRSDEKHPPLILLLSSELDIERNAGSKLLF